MSAVEPITKDEIRQIGNGFASIFKNNNKSNTEEKSISQTETETPSPTDQSSQSTKPKRQVIRGRRKGDTNNNNNNNGNVITRPNYNNNNDNNDKSSTERRMKRKRHFDVMQTGSVTLANIMREASYDRIPKLTLCYVRRIPLPVGSCDDDNKNNNINNSNNINNIQSQTNQTKTNNNNNNNAFAVMMDNKNRQLQNYENNDCKMNESNNNNNNNNIQLSRFNVPIREPNLIGINEEWVQVFSSYSDACNIKHWKLRNRNGKIEEYQIDCKQSIYVINLEKSKSKINLKTDEQSICDYVLAQGYAGYILDGTMMLYKPYAYWRLIDDNKIKGTSQFLISDMFRLHEVNSNQFLVSSNNNNNNNNGNGNEAEQFFKF